MQKEPVTSLNKPATDARVLVVDDDDAVCRALTRVLAGAGWTVTTAENAEEALSKVQTTMFDAIISDVSMPGGDGLTLLQEIRDYDLDVPVLLLTGEPTLARASLAIEYGVYRFYTKPVEPSTLTQAVASAIAVGRAARVRREALAAFDNETRARADIEGSTQRLDEALEHLWMAFQPIVSHSRGVIVAYEALVRCRAPDFPNPGALLDAAQRINRMHALGRRIRENAANAFSTVASDTRLFVNLHPTDLEDEMLFSSECPLHALASRVTLEITERAPLPPLDTLLPKLARLRRAGYQIAIDDLGAGYSGLSNFAWLEPEVIKLDMSIVRGIESSGVRQKLARAMIALSRELGCQFVAEGVETAAERDVLVSLGCDLFQGYLFALPGPAFPDANFS